MSMHQVPVIDLSRPDEELASQVLEACTNTGFFYVSGHGVPEAVVENHFEQSRALFALPPEAKMKLAADKNNRGYTPLGEETLDPTNSSAGDAKEGYYLGREVPAESSEASLPLHGPNVWPPQELLPGFRPAMQEYFAAMMGTATRLLRLLGLALGLPAGHFLQYFDRPMVFLRPLHYSAQLSDAGKGKYAAGAHSDYGMLTLLAVADSAPGLQIEHQGRWLDVAGKPQTFIVNLGDMLERWTNGKVKSTRHRVINASGRDRYSTAFFFDPNFDARVEALPQCCGKGEQPRFPPTTAGQHLLDMYAQTHSGYADYTGPVFASDVMEKQEQPCLS